MLNNNNRKEMNKLAFFAICIMALMGIVSCNGNGGKNVVDGGHGIGIDTATINAIEQEEAAERQGEELHTAHSPLCLGPHRRRRRARERWWLFNRLRDRQSRR